MEDLIRLQKYLAEAGIASRRKCEEYIVQGRVKVNNKIAELGIKINPENPEEVKNIYRVETVKDVKTYMERLDDMIERKRKTMEEISWH